MTTADMPALDPFDVPPMSHGLADRIVRAALARPVPARRDRRGLWRRGLWRRGRQVVVGTLAAGMLSAAAVASGLLDRAGIEVPVLTAMLSPAHRAATPKVHRAPRVQAAAQVQAKHPLAIASTATAPSVPVAPPTQAPMVRPVQPTAAQLMRRELAMERHEARVAFAQEHPRVAAVIERRVREKLRRDAIERGQPLASPSFDPSLSGYASPPDETDAALARAARRQRRRVEAMIDRRIARRAQIAAARAAMNDGTSQGDVGIVTDVARPMPESKAEGLARLPR